MDGLEAGKVGAKMKAMIGGALEHFSGMAVNMR